MSDDLFGLIVIGWTALALPTLVAGLTGNDPVGRLGGNPRGPRVDPRWGWFVMELPALCVLPAVYFAGADRHAVGDLLAAAWVLHYGHRTLVWPWIAQRHSRPLPWPVCASSFVFNVVNGLLLGWFLARVADYPDDWFADVRFLAGAAAFLLGAALNVVSDYQLVRQRAERPGEYVVPRGGAFQYVSSPNLTGEIVEWAGFALMSWSLPGLSFAVWTAANLIPRAVWRHRWYRRKFAGYPESRRAVFPGVL